MTKKTLRMLVVGAVWLYFCFLWTAAMLWPHWYLAHRASLPPTVVTGPLVILAVGWGTAGWSWRRVGISIFVLCVMWAVLVARLWSIS